MRVSAVVPTRNRPQKLESCLRALGDQTIALEVVVVDDGSVDGERVASIVEAHGARLVRLDGRGPASARNAGVAGATGEVVCFTDDDCEPDPHWADALSAAVGPGGRGAAAGRTVVAEDAGTADRAWQAIADHLQRSGADPRSPSPGFAATCNLACGRVLLTELPFDEGFPIAAGEDRDWAARAAARGSAPRYVPEALVVHRPGLDVAGFLRQQYRYGRGAAGYRRAEAGRRLGSPRFYAGLLAAGFRAGLGAGLLVCAAQLATALGAAVEVTRR